MTKQESDYLSRVDREMYPAQGVAWATTGLHDEAMCVDHIEDMRAAREKIQISMAFGTEAGR